jgi:peptidyl-tRNA hydrolase, PTH1 family
VSPQIKLIVGLGNPGPEYSETRHNAGFWFVDRLITTHNASFSADRKFFGETTRFSLEGVDCRALKPETFMNHSGRAVMAITDYYGIDPAEVLIAHDEIDLEAGTVRIKKDGGHGGHNGLRDVIEQTGHKDFLRLRIGVGHPGHKDDVIDYVLNRPDMDDKKHIEESIERAVEIMPLLFKGEHNKAMTLLNGDKRLDKNSEGEDDDL